jgi:hypothetical protein
MEMTRSSLVRCQAAHKRLVAAGTLVAVGKTTEFALDRVLMLLATRPTRGRLGMVGVPLAIVAVVLSGLWWAVLPLSVCAWWWSPSSWGWEWLSAVGRGLVGVEWAYMGSGALAAFPNGRWAVAAVWAGFPAALVIHHARKT